MAKEIVAHKLIIDLNPDGTFRDGVFQYRIRIDGAMQEKYYTVGISNGVDAAKVQALITASKTHAEKAEKIQ